MKMKYSKTNMDSVSIKDYFDSKINCLEEINKIQDIRYQEKFDAQQMAIKLAADFLEQYKGFTNDQINRLERDINTLKEGGGGESKGRRDGISGTWTTVISILSLLVGAGVIKLLT